MFLAFAAASVLASTAFAQSSSFNLSQACQTTLGNLAVSSDGACINAAGLLTGFATLSGDSSIISPINSWLTGACSQQACSNQSLANLVNNFTSGCASDLSSLGFSSSDSSAIVADVQQFYPTVRQVACLKNSTSGNLCATDLLTDIQSATGTLSENNLGSLITTFLSGSTALQNVLQSAACSNCVKAGLNIIEQNVPGLITDSDKSNLTSTCGSSFTNGQNPSDITQTAAGLSTGGSNNSGALASFPITTLTLALSALASVFVVFA